MSYDDPYLEHWEALDEKLNKLGERCAKDINERLIPCLPSLSPVAPRDLGALNMPILERLGCGPSIEHLMLPEHAQKPFQEFLKVYLDG